MGPNYLPRMYENLIFVPLDLPPLGFDRTEFLEWFDARKQRGMEEYVRKIGYPWNVVWLLSPEYQPELLESPLRNLPELLKQLPHRLIQRIYLLEQLIEVPHHRDVSREEQVELGPSTYRNMLINDAIDSTFYYLRGTEYRKNLDPTPIFPKFPPDTRWFAHNNYASHHGSFMPPESVRKVLLCIWGQVEPLSHLALIEQSRQKYPEFVIE
jgi:hypothetical protein